MRKQRGEQSISEFKLRTQVNGDPVRSLILDLVFDKPNTKIPDGGVPRLTAEDVRWAMSILRKVGSKNKAKTPRRLSFDKLCQIFMVKMVTAFSERSAPQDGYTQLGCAVITQAIHDLYEFVGAGNIPNGMTVEDISTAVDFLRSGGDGWAYLAGIDPDFLSEMLRAPLLGADGVVPRAASLLSAVTQEAA